VKSAIIDGEIAIPDDHGITHIDMLNVALRHAPERLAFTPSTCFGSTISTCASAGC
jgi:hypothetical protein